MIKKAFTKIRFAILLFIFLNGCASFAQAQPPTPNPAQLAWQQAELGVVFHYDLHVFDASLYNQTHNRVTPVPDYNIFNPQQLDVEQWVLAAKAAGARFAIITATHETGFAIYQSDVNPYCMKALKWKEGKADLVKDFTDACRKHGIQPGVYIGIRWNSFFGVHNFVVEGTGDMQKNRQAYYNKMVEGMVTELCTRYGPLFEVWFDGGAGNPENGTPHVLPIVKKYQPGALFYWNAQLAEARWGGSESGTVGYPCWSTFTFPSTYEPLYPQLAKNNYQLLKEGDARGKYWIPAMADAPLRGYKGRHEWFWEPGDEKHIYPLNDLMDMYLKSVGRNATLIVGLTPDDRGLLPEPDVQRLKEWGEEIKKTFGRPLAATSGKGKNFSLLLKQPAEVRYIMIQENIAKGHRVKQFTVQALVQGKWIKVTQGKSVGNKFIHKLPQPLTTGRLRLVIEDVFAEPDLIGFSVF